jgi:hypothetical protein
MAIPGCGKNFYFAGRVLPPSGLANRVLVAIQNPGAFTQGTLQFEDAYYDVRHSANNLTGVFSIGGYSGALPISIQNMPEQTLGAVYNSGSGGTYSLIDYQGEKQTRSVSLAGPASSIFITKDQHFIYAANQQAHSFSVLDQVSGSNYYLNLPGVYRVAVNPGGTIVLAFVQNSDLIYSLVHLNQAQTTAAGLSSDPQHFQIGNQTAQDCEPQNLPQYCIFQVCPPSANCAASFDRPQKAIFSADGSAAYILNCGPECGGVTAGVTTVPLTAASLNNNATGAVGLNLIATTTLAVPGGASNALQNGSTLYLAGQQLQPDGLLAGVLSIVDLPSQTVTASYGISDGNHGRIILADDNTLWIGSTGCLLGERYKNSQPSGAPFGCLTMFNTATNKVFIDTYKGDLTGEAAVLGLHKLYVAEGGQIHIYNTTDGSERDNGNVTVNGTAYDVAYMDSATDSDNTVY